MAVLGEESYDLILIYQTISQETRYNRDYLVVFNDQVPSWMPYRQVQGVITFVRPISSLNNLWVYYLRKVIVHFMSDTYLSFSALYDFKPI